MRLLRYSPTSLLLLFSWLAPAALIAHPAIDAQVAIVNQRLEQEPLNASLYFKRAQLHQTHRAWDAAREDYQRALEIDAKFAAARIRLSEVLLEAGRSDDAKRRLDEFLQDNANHVDGLVLRGRINFALGAFTSAVADYDRAINLSARPQPDWFIERARAAAESDAGISHAIAGLDEGLVRLGPLVTLQGAAIELEVRRLDYESALMRVDRLLAPQPRQPQWLVKRAELLALLGRQEEARLGYQSALEAIAVLPGNRRSAKMIADLARQARRSIDMSDAAISSDPDKE